MVGRGSGEVGVYVDGEAVEGVGEGGGGPVVDVAGK